jgi:hypothetical protein
MSFFIEFSKSADGRECFPPKCWVWAFHKMPTDRHGDITDVTTSNTCIKWHDRNKNGQMKNFEGVKKRDPETACPWCVDYRTGDWAHKEARKARGLPLIRPESKR